MPTPSHYLCPLTSFASRTLEACVFQGWDSLLLRVLTWSSRASPSFSLRSHVRSQNPLQIRLVQWEVYTHSRYTQEKEQKPITSSHIRALIPVLSYTWQIFSLDGFSPLNVIGILVLSLKFLWNLIIVLLYLKFHQNLITFVTNYFELRTLHQRYMDGN